MRTKIKFRAWDAENRRYIQSPLIVIDSSGPKAYVDNREFEDAIDRDCVVEQFTGLKDRNGKEIYEGDICRLSIKGLGITVISQMKYFEDFSMFAFSSVPHYYVRTHDDRPMGSSGSSTPWKPYLPGSYKSIEVIGNIHESPELLKP